ncbi:MAG: diphosphate--fructose-6-phosphate 1-phosphotransferase [Candidatus Omnitrophica bacterium]|nr:diphosphate--fructose-6-phosphate 1-phosphotransferase [Candidatus Omnitrophota bacterium]
MKEKAIVGQSGGCTAVINASLAGIIDGVKSGRSVGSLYGAWHGIEGILEESFTDLLKQPASIVKALRATPSSALGSCRHKLTEREADKAVSIFRKHGVTVLFLIGGNDTAETALTVSRHAKSRNYSLRTVVVPKTIDNDLPVTDHTPGYGSAARFIAQATQEAGLDTEAMRRVDPVKIIEVMGRDSGWLVASSVLGKKSDREAPHLLYFPERPFDKRKFIGDTERVLGKNGFAVIVVSETIRDSSGRRVGEKEEGVLKDGFGHPYMESAAAKLVRWVEESLKVRARYDKPGTILRMSIPYISSVDQSEAYRAGKEAVRLALRGENEIMVTFVRASDRPYFCRMGKVHVSEIAGKEKKLPASFISQSGTFVTDKFRKYAMPLIGKPLASFANLIRYQVPDP